MAFLLGLGCWDMSYYRLAGTITANATGCRDERGGHFGVRAEGSKALLQALQLEAPKHPKPSTLNPSTLNPKP